jgi:UDP-MurNAc hydroxylase
MVERHKLLKSKVTIPFASFVRFSRQDNQHMNEFVNTVFDVKEKFLENDVQLVRQAIGGNSIEWSDVTSNANNDMEIDEQGEKYFSTQMHIVNDEHDYKQINQMELKKTIEDRVAEWQKVSSKAVLKFLKLEPMKFRITDWNDEIWKVDFYNGTFSNLQTEEYDISISSQPLFQAFKMPFGIQTLGVSGRYRFADKYRDVPTKWKKIRIISSLYNAEIYLHPRSVFSLTTLRWLWSRRLGLISQIFQQMKRFS